MQATRRSNAIRGALCCVVVLLLGSAGRVGATHLVGTWTAAAGQPDPELAARLGPLPDMEITPTHITAFGEAPVGYRYERDGQVFRLTADAPGATPIDLRMPDGDTLRMRLPNGIELVWQRLGEAPAPPVGSAADGVAAGATARSPDTGLMSGLMAMVLPHSRPTRYELLDESLESLLNSGWTITHASGAAGGMALVLKRAERHVVCMLVGDLQDRAAGRSDCRRIN